MSELPYRERMRLLKERAKELKRKMLRHYNEVESAYRYMETVATGGAVKFKITLPDKGKSYIFLVTLDGDEPAFIPETDFDFRKRHDNEIVRLCGQYAGTYLRYIRVQRSIDALNREYRETNQRT